MNWVIAMLVLGAAMSAAGATSTATKAPPDGIWAPGKMDEVLQDPRLLDGYLRCLLDKGDCTPEGAQLKLVLTSRLLANCSQCSQQQNATSNQLMNYLIDNQPEAWSSLEGKLDPQAAYRKGYLSNKAESPQQDNMFPQDNGKKKDPNDMQDPKQPQAADPNKQKPSSSPSPPK